MAIENTLDQLASSEAWYFYVKERDWLKATSKKSISNCIYTVLQVIGYAPAHFVLIKMD